MDKNGFLIAVLVTVANIHDSKAVTLLMQILNNLCSSVKIIIADGGYSGQLAENIINTFGYVLQVIISGYKKQRFRPIKGRWVIERTFAWFDNDRRLCRNYETSFDAAEQIVKISAIKLVLNTIKQVLSYNIYLFKKAKILTIFFSIQDYIGWDRRKKYKEI